MSTVEDIVAWQETIPLPYVNYQGSPNDARLCSDLSQSYISRRARFQASVVNITATWILTEAQYDLFRAFFRSSLYMGASVFTIGLRYPYNALLTTWRARFIGGYSAETEEGDSWKVEGKLGLLYQGESIPIDVDAVVFGNPQTNEVFGNPLTGEVFGF